MYIIFYGIKKKTKKCLGKKNQKENIFFLYRLRHDKLLRLEKNVEHVHFHRFSS